MIPPARHRRLPDRHERAPAGFDQMGALEGWSRSSFDARKAGWARSLGPSSNRASPHPWRRSQSETGGVYGLARERIRRQLQAGDLSARKRLAGIGTSAYGSGISGLSSSRARSNAGRGVSERTCSSQNTPS